MSDLKQQAEALLADVDRGETERRYSRLTPADRALVLRLLAKGNLTQAEIAKAVGCTQPTVSRIAALLDTRKEARTILESGAAKLADTVVNTDDAGIALKALGKLDVVRDDRDGSSTVGPIIVIGSPIAQFGGFQAGDRIQKTIWPADGLEVFRMIGTGRAINYPIPNDFELGALPPDVVVDPEAQPLLEARGLFGFTVDAPQPKAGTKVLIGMAPPGTSQNPIPVGRGSSGHDVA